MIDFEALGFMARDYLDRYSKAKLERFEIQKLRHARQATLFDPRISKYKDAVQAVTDIKSETFDFSGDVVKIGQASDLSGDQAERFQKSLETFRPWKKGPFELFGTEIDAEWRSDLKWNRILDEIGSLKNRRVADIGCHNGYYMFRMAEHNPACVIGFEPTPKHFWNFQLMQNVVQHERLTFELLGVEHFDLYPSFFNTIFCLGILYHHTDPIGLLRKLRSSLEPKGEIVIDCQGIPGDEPIALVPENRYAKARGIWFLPTQSCLENWVSRAGYSNIRCIHAQPLSTDEQRRTEWAPIDSLAEFLDPEDPTRTVEGYPAPWRYYIVAQK